MIGGIILTHGEFGAGIKNALEGMMGEQKGLRVLTNTGLSKEKLKESLEEAIGENEFKEGVFVFVDMPGSSCWLTAKTLKDHNKKIAIITGVNLPMLVTFFGNRERLAFEKLIEKVKETGQKGIT